MTVRLKWRYLTFIFIFILGSVLVQTFYANFKYQELLDQKVESFSAHVHDYYNDLFQSLNDKYYALALNYAFEPLLTELYLNRDREGLMDSVGKDYLRLQSLDPDLHFMQFIDTQNRSILRLHQPTVYDDDLTKIRPLVRVVNQSKQALTGFEVGRNGIAYRIVTPMVNQQNQHIGVIEFGVRPDYFVNRLVDRFGVESMILAKTDSLAGLQEDFGFSMIQDYSIVQVTNFFSKNLSKIDLNLDQQIIKEQGRTYLILTNLNQLNDQQQVVSKTLVATEITSIKHANQVSLIKVAILNFIVLLFLWAMIYAMFSRYSRALARSYDTIQALYLQSSALKTQANTDELTGLYNRRFFNESLQSKLKLGETGSLLFFDIDHFKQLNDAHGHPAGDQVLVELAKMLTGFFRQDDLIVRWGGEEFAVFISDMPGPEAREKAERFRHLVETTSQHHQPYAFTISGGVTQIRAGDSLKDIFKRADKRLYLAKQDGRNQIVGVNDSSTRPGDH